MDKIDKALVKLTKKQRDQLFTKFNLLCIGQFEGLNIKKMKGYRNLYRLRVGNVRLIYKQTVGKQPVIMYIGKRDDQTYRDF